MYSFNINYCEWPGRGVALIISDWLVFFCIKRRGGENKKTIESWACELCVVTLLGRISAAFMEAFWFCWTHTLRIGPRFPPHNISLLQNMYITVFTTDISSHGEKSSTKRCNKVYRSSFPQYWQALSKENSYNYKALIIITQWVLCIGMAISRGFLILNLQY